MSLKANINTKPVNFFQTGFASNDPHLKNHQNWEINRELDIKTGAPIFHVKDKYGDSHAIKEFIIEDVDPSAFEQELIQLRTAEDEQQLICQYLQERLNQATRFSVHIEKFDNTLAIRFGDYGLKGGGKTKTMGLIGSVLQIGVGIISPFFPFRGARLISSVLISSGLGSGGYILGKEERDLEVKEYCKQGAYGALSGVITTCVGWFSSGAGVIYKIGILALGGGVNSAATTVAAELVDKGKLPESSAVIKKAGAGAAGGVVGACIGTLFDLWKLADDARHMYIFKKAIEGGTSSAGSTYATNLYDSEIEDKSKGLKESALIGGLLSGSIAFADLMHKTYGWNKTKNQKEQADEALNAAKAEKEQTEKAKQRLEGISNQLEQKLVEMKNELKLSEEKIVENQLKRKQTEQSISEAQKTADLLEQQLRVAMQEVLVLEQQVEKNKLAINEAQKVAAITEQQLLEAEQKAQQANQQHDQLMARADKKIRSELEKGKRAKIGHHRPTRSYRKIRAAFEAGKTFEWVKDELIFFKSSKKVKTAPFQKDTEPQIRVEQAQQKVNELKADIERRQLDLKIVQERQNAQQQHVDQTQAGLTALEVQQKQADLLQLQDQLTFLQEWHQLAQQELIAEQRIYADLEFEANKVKGKIPEVQSKVNQLETLSKAEQEAFAVAEQELKRLAQDPAAKQFLHLLGLTQSNESLAKALKPEPAFSSPQIRDVSELKSHMVLVHAIPDETAMHFINRQEDGSAIKAELMEKYFDDVNFRYRLCIKTDLTSEGVLAPHLQRRRNFEDPFIARPQIHWCCNQLVQPVNNDKDNWEYSSIAVLEPLSMFGCGMNHNPHGVATYDTMTLGAHFLSEKSTLLIPHELLSGIAEYNQLANFTDERFPVFLIPNTNGCADKVKCELNLAKFKGQIVTYKQNYLDGRGQNLRKAVMQTLKKVYPETWHICEEDRDSSDAPKETGWEALPVNGSGRRSKTSLISPDGKRHVICRKNWQGEYVIESDAFKKYAENRVNDFHVNSYTYYFDDEKQNRPGNNRYIDSLKAIINKTRNLKDIKDQEPALFSRFAGGIKDNNYLENLGSLEMLKQCECLEKLPEDTGVMEEVKYYLDRAMYADLISLFYVMNQNGEFDLFTPELVIIFDSERDNLIKLLKNIKDAETTSEQKQRAFDAYCQALKNCYNVMQQAKHEASFLTTLDEDNNLGEEVSQISLFAGMDKWEEVNEPDDIDFDLRKNWPFSEKLQAYTDTVSSALPTEPEACKQLYQQLTKEKPQERKEQYRINILRTLIQFSYQKNTYLAMRMNALVQS